MDVGFREEEDLLRATCRQFLEEEAPIREVREVGEMGETSR